MKATPENIERVRPRLLVMAAMALAAGIALGFVAPGSWAAACRFVVFACLAPALGSMLFALIHRLTGGQWGIALKPFLAAGSLLAPWVWLAALPLLLFLVAPGSEWPSYGSRGMLALRGVFYGGVLFALARPLSRPDEPRGGWVGPAGFIGVVFMLHLLAEDWLSALDSGWHSTAFPLVWMTGMSVTGLACALIAALACGAEPQVKLPEPRTFGIDWGNLLLSAVLFWWYVAFAQFLIIWAGNLPSEISWFQQRTRNGWVIVPPLLVAINFVLPMAVLLSRTFKLSKKMLLGVATFLVLGQALYAAWLILPAFPAIGPAALAMSAALFIASASLFVYLYLGAGLRRMKTQ